MPFVNLNPTLRWLFRAPIQLYRCNLGWLLGHRFMLLGHVGRRTGRHRQTVLEVMEYRADGPEAIVMCAFGAGADWFRNIQATPDLDVWLGRRHFTATYRILAAEEAVSAVKGYEQRNWIIAPIVRAVLSRLLGWRYDGSECARLRLATQLPMIAFHPKAPPPH